MNGRLTQPEYQLLWPKRVFTAEAANLLNQRHASDWQDRCGLLLEHAFAGGSDAGPRADFENILVDDWGSQKRPSALTPKQEFLKSLMTKADRLRDSASQRAPYWSERKAGQRLVVVLDPPGLVREYVELTNTLDNDGYFERALGKDCVDDERQYRAARIFHRELGIDDPWPLSTQRLINNLDGFFDIVEMMHDIAALPRNRHLHSYGGCGWHHSEFAVEPGRAIYRWRVNKIFERSSLGLRLADEGSDIGRLVSATDDARSALINVVVSRQDEGPADQVRHAVELFRARGADRNQKRSAVAALALVLEERRRNVLTEALDKSDRGALFQLANEFHIRHQDAKQKREYDEFYLDWIFWIYLSTVELTNRVIDAQ